MSSVETVSVIKPLLYSYWRSSCSWRVRAVLNYKNVDYEIRPVNLIKDGGQQKSAEYLGVNPAGVVPSLVIGDTALTESTAIIEYLEQTYPNPSILPEDPVQRAQIRAVAFQIACNIQPVQNVRVLTYLGNERKAEWARHWIHKGFQVLEKMIEKKAGKYCFGDTVTMADFYMVPQVYNAQRYCDTREMGFDSFSQSYSPAQDDHNKSSLIKDENDNDICNDSHVIGLNSDFEEEQSLAHPDSNLQNATQEEISFSHVQDTPQSPKKLFSSFSRLHTQTDAENEEALPKLSWSWDSTDDVIVDTDTGQTHTQSSPTHKNPHN